MHPSRYRYLTLLLIINFILRGILQTTFPYWGLLSAILFTVMAGALFWAFRKQRSRLAVLLLINFFLIVLRWSNLIRADRILTLVILGTSMAFYLSVIITVFQNLLRSEHVNIDTVYGSVAIYLMLGHLWMVLYDLILLFSPGSFLVLAGDMDTFYFSFITLVGVGYGDIVPVTPLARLAATTEGITGTLYVAIVIARVVGLYISDYMRKK